jgi:hypothetical protein
MSMTGLDVFDTTVHKTKTPKGKPEGLTGSHILVMLS